MNVYIVSKVKWSSAFYVTKNPKRKSKIFKWKKENPKWSLSILSWNEKQLNAAENQITDYNKKSQRQRLCDTLNI